MSRQWWLVGAGAAALAMTAQVLATVPTSRADETSTDRSKAAQGWGPVTVLADNPQGESLVVDAHNHTTAVWATSSAPRSIVARRRAADGSWSKAVVIGRGYAPQADADARGNVTIVWLNQRRGFTDGVSAARRPAGGHWSDPVRLSHDRNVSGYPHDGEGVYGAAEVDLAVSRNGAVAVSWAWGSDDRSVPWRIQATYRPPDASWERLRNVTPASGAKAPKIAIDATGTAVLAYGRQLFGHPQVLKVRRRILGMGWTKPVTVAAEGYGHSIAVDRTGNAVVVFTPNFNRVKAVYRRADGRWGAARAISPAGVTVNDFALSMNGVGASVIALGRGNGRVDLVSRPPDGPWSQPVRVALPGPTVYDVVVALNESGDTFLGWGGYALYGKYRPHGGDWSRRFTVSPDAGVEVLEAALAQVAPERRRRRDVGSGGSAAQGAPDERALSVVATAFLRMAEEGRMP